MSVEKTGLRKPRRDKANPDKKKWMAALKMGVAKLQGGADSDTDDAAGKRSKITARGTNRW